jgi:PhnB protein
MPDPADYGVPEGYTAVTPWVISRDTAALIEFLRDAFDAEEIDRVYVAEGVIGHAEARIGDSVVLMFDSADGWPPTPAFLRLYVPDADAVHDRAVAAGARTVTEVRLMAWGDRVGRVADPFGNIWWLQSREEDVSPDEIAERMSDPTFLDAMEYVMCTLDEEMKRRGASGWQ